MNVCVSPILISLIAGSVSSVERYCLGRILESTVHFAPICTVFPDEYTIPHPIILPVRIPVICSPSLVPLKVLQRVALVAPVYPQRFVVEYCAGIG